MIEIKGDFWEECNELNVYHAIVCTTNTTVKNNGNLTMGLGIALQFAMKFGYLPEIWGDIVKSGHKSVIFSPIEFHPIMYAIALPTKYDWKLPSPEWLVIQSCKEMLFVVNCLGLKKILMTRAGCGQGKLQWETLKPKLEFLDDRFTVIYNDK